MHERLRARRILAALAVSLMLPAAAFAASEVRIDDVAYTQESHPQGASGAGSSGGTWSWDGADAMVLENYDGGAIAAVGDLTITLEGQNRVSTEPTTGAENRDATACAVSIKDGNLTIGGEGSLDAVSYEPTWDARESIEGNGVIVANGGSITVDGAEVTSTLLTNAENRPYIDERGEWYDWDMYPLSGIAALRGDISIVNGADVTVEIATENENPFVHYAGIWALLPVPDDHEAWIHRWDGVSPFGMPNYSGAYHAPVIRIDSSTVSSTVSNNSTRNHFADFYDSYIQSLPKVPEDERDTFITALERESARDATQSPGIGIYAWTDSYADFSGVPTISIKDSTVRASGNSFSMLATSAFSSRDEAPGGAIEISGSSTVITPEGGRVQDIVFPYGSDEDLAYVFDAKTRWNIAAYGQEDFFESAGQTIGLGEGAIESVYSDNIVADVLIRAAEAEPEPAPEVVPEPEPEPAAPKAHVRSALPKTADATLLAEGALAASGALLALAGLVRRKRRG